MPKRLTDLTTFAKMLATRYNGHHGFGNVGLWSVWNEPNLQLFLTPQFSGTKIVSPAEYANLYKAAYNGIKAGNKLAQVAIGETSNLGRDKPTALAGQGQSVRPARSRACWPSRRGSSSRRGRPIRTRPRPMRSRSRRCAIRTFRWLCSRPSRRT